MMTAPVLEVANLAVRYGKIEALHQAAIKVGAGQIVSVIGPNGAGKSTLLNAIMGALPQTGHASGRIAYLGEEIGALPIERRVARGMCLVPEKRELFASMTVEDNLVLGAYRRKRAGERNFLDQLDHEGNLSHHQRAEADRRRDAADRAERAGGSANFGLRLRAGNRRSRARRAGERAGAEPARDRNVSGAGQEARLISSVSAELGGVFHVKHAAFFRQNAERNSGVNGPKPETVIIRAYHFF
jgi:ABC-type Fe3+/spermidine/putrescine transport system ATPase subunit